jgi:hypothetical protein
MLNSSFVNNGEPDGGAIRIIAIFVGALVSLQVFPDEEDEPAADLLDVVQGEVYANLCSLFPHLDPAFLKVGRNLLLCAGAFLYVRSCTGRCSGGNRDVGGKEGLFWAPKMPFHRAQLHPTALVLDDHIKTIK